MVPSHLKPMKDVVYVSEKMLLMVVQTSKLTFSRCSRLSQLGFKVQPLKQYSQLAFRNNTLRKKKSLSKFNQIHISRSFSREGFGAYLTTDFAPIAYFVQVLESIHDWTGLPWWITILATTITLRTCFTLPLTLSSMKAQKRLQILQPEMQAKAVLLKKEVMSAQKLYDWDDRTTFLQFKSNMKRITQELYVRDNCHPWKTILSPYTQLPLWICMSLSLRNLAGALPILGSDVPVLRPDLATEGILWFPNLLLPESTLILPISLGLINLAITEIAVLQKGEPTKFQRNVTYFFRGLSVVLIPISAIVPSCLCFYWTCSASYGLIQGLLLKYPKVRSLFGIQKTATDSNTPFKDMWDIAKDKYTFRKNS